MQSIDLIDYLRLAVKTEAENQRLIRELEEILYAG